MSTATRVLKESEWRSRKYYEVDLVVEPDHKNGGKMFRPEYFEADPWANNEPTMRFYLCPEIQNLLPGRKLKGWIKEVKDTGKKNKRGAKILMVYVRINSSR